MEYETETNIVGHFYSSCHKSSFHNATTSSVDSAIHVGNSFPLSHHASDHLRVLTNMGARRPPRLQTSNPSTIWRGLRSLTRYGHCIDNASRVATREGLRGPYRRHAINYSPSTIHALLDPKRMNRGFVLRSPSCTFDTKTCPRKCSHEYLFT